MIAHRFSKPEKPFVRPEPLAWVCYMILVLLFSLYCTQKAAEHRIKAHPATSGFCACANGSEQRNLRLAVEPATAKVAALNNASPVGIKLRM